MANTNQTTMVYEKLRERIEQGYYSPAESLPEIELAAEYSVSRSTIKKALLMLEKDALVVIEQNKGTKVRSYSKAEILDFLELRAELEGFIVRLAVPKFAKKDIQKLELLISEMEKKREDADLLGYSAVNQEFHALIYEVCPNKMATDMLLKLKTQMRKYNAKTILVPGRDARSFEEHKMILEAIQKQDASTAEKCMRSHIDNVRQTFEEYYALLF